MPITLCEAVAAVESVGYRPNQTTTKLIEYESPKHGRVLYLRTNQGFPAHADLMIHPDTQTADFIQLAGIAQNKRAPIRFSSNEKRFPKKINKGRSAQHFGKAFYALSFTSIVEFCKRYDQ